MKVYGRKETVQGGHGFSAAELRRFPLVELVARQGENLPAGGVVRQTLPAGNAAYVSSCSGT